MTKEQQTMISMKCNLVVCEVAHQLTIKDYKFTEVFPKS
jgi:hypothetical protein